MASYITKSNNYGGPDTGAIVGVTKDASATAFVVAVTAVRNSAGTITISSPAYSGGGTVSLIGSQGNGVTAVYLYFVLGPTGNGNFTATISAASYWEVDVVQLANCTYVNPTVNTGSGTGTSSGAAVMSIPSGGIAIDSIALTYNNDGGLAASGGWTSVLLASRYSTLSHYEVYNATAGNQSNTFSWTGSEVWSRVQVLAQTSKPAGGIIFWFD